MTLKSYDLFRILQRILSKLRWYIFKLQLDQLETGEQLCTRKEAQSRRTRYLCRSGRLGKRLSWRWRFQLGICNYNSIVYSVKMKFDVSSNYCVTNHRLWKRYDNKDYPLLFSRQVGPTNCSGPKRSKS